MAPGCDGLAWVNPTAAMKKKRRRRRRSNYNWRDETVTRTGLLRRLVGIISLSADKRHEHGSRKGECSGGYRRDGCDNGNLDSCILGTEPLAKFHSYLLKLSLQFDRGKEDIGAQAMRSTCGPVEPCAPKPPRDAECQVSSPLDPEEHGLSAFTNVCRVRCDCCSIRYSGSSPRCR